MLGMGWHLRLGWAPRGTTALPATTIASIAVTGNATVGGTLGVTGTMTAATVNAGAIGGSSLLLTGAAAIGTTLDVNGATTLAAVTLDSNADLTMGAGGQILADYGTAAEPGYAFGGDADLGFYREAANQLKMVAGSSNWIAYFAGAGLVAVYQGTVTIGSALNVVVGPTTIAGNLIQTAGYYSQGRIADPGNAADNVCWIFTKDLAADKSTQISRAAATSGVLVLEA